MQICYYKYVFQAIALEQCRTARHRHGGWSTGNVLTPCVAYGVEAGLRYSDPVVVEARLAAIVEEFRAVLSQSETRATIPFNRKYEWGEDGRIIPGAPVHSPVIRRKQRLELE